jgi:hypothetical protein
MKKFEMACLTLLVVFAAVQPALGSPEQINPAASEHFGSNHVDCAADWAAPAIAYGLGIGKIDPKVSEAAFMAAVAIVKEQMQVAASMCQKNHSLTDAQKAVITDYGFWFNVAEMTAAKNPFVLRNEAVLIANVLALPADKFQLLVNDEMNGSDYNSLLTNVDGDGKEFMGEDVRSFVSYVSALAQIKVAMDHFSAN